MKNEKIEEILWIIYWSSSLWLPFLSLTFDILDFDRYRFFWIIWGVSFPVVFAYGIGKSKRD